MGHPLLREQNIISGLVASNHEDALKKIVAALPDSSLTPRERSKVLDLLLLREEMGTTAIGQGIALPHCFTPLVTQPLVAFAVSPEGIPYASLDGLPVHFIFRHWYPIRSFFDSFFSRKLASYRSLGA